jgi:hypothetical protein
LRLEKLVNAQAKLMAVLAPAVTAATKAALGNYEIKATLQAVECLVDVAEE